MIHTARVSVSQCQSCGHVGEPTSKFCGGCGTPMAPLSNQVTAPNTYHQNQQVYAAPGYQPQQQNQQISAAPGYQPQQQNQQVYAAPGYQPQQQNQQVYAAPGYRPQQQNQQATAAPGYRPQQQLAAAPNAYAVPPRPDGFIMPPPPGTQVITEVLPPGVPGNPARPSVPLSDRSVPAFAHVKAPVTANVSAELKQEAAKLMLLLARERLFLLFHWGTFIGLNLLGCWLGLKCYFEFFGDEMSKIMMASTPFLFINSVALCCLVSIKGTRSEIERLQERTQYIKFKMEFGHLM